MTDKSDLKKYIERESISWMKILMPAYIAALMAPLYYFFDLFSHFCLQYAVGGLLLGAALFYFKRWKWALVALSIMTLSAVESRIHLQEPLRFFPPGGQSQITIASFNQNVGQTEFKWLTDFLTKNAHDIDVAILIEASHKTVNAAQQLQEIYPYQIHEPQDDAFGMVILSKHPFKEHKKLFFNGIKYRTWAARIVIHPPAMKSPITIYGMHPLPPTGPVYTDQRDFELLTLAEKVAKDESTNKVMIGDWNITPFSPIFGKLLQSSGMNFQSYGLMLNPTWPTFLFLPIFQIPIDHALFSDNLIQTDKKTQSGLMSDHKMLIARFTEK